MVLTILKWVGAAMILSLVALWLWQGGYWKIADYANIIPNPLEATSTDMLFQLPGQPQFFEIPDTTSGENEMEYGAADYEDPSDALYQEQSFGPQPDTEQSPYAGFVDLQIGGAQSSDPSDEYVVLLASQFAAVPIPVSGWSVRSALSGMRATIPLAASPFYQGVVNSVGPIMLRSGERVVLSSGASPVGISFRETTCTGYLAQTQRFSPSLSNSCPRPTTLLPRTSENEARYGASCVNFVERLAQCSYPTLIPNDVSQSCRAYLSNTFTYSGCMRAYGSGETQNLNSWRAYETSSSELWGNSHDTLVLLDGEGRVVTTLRY